jgi:hypothetical protein
MAISSAANLIHGDGAPEQYGKVVAVLKNRNNIVDHHKVENYI